MCKLIDDDARNVHTQIHILTNIFINAYFNKIETIKSQFRDFNEEINFSSNENWLKKKYYF